MPVLPVFTGEVVNNTAAEKVVRAYQSRCAGRVPALAHARGLLRMPPINARPVVSRCGKTLLTITSSYQLATYSHSCPHSETQGDHMLRMKFRIGTKLALSAAVGVLLVAGMLVSQMLGSASVDGSYTNSTSQHVVAEDSIDVKASARGMMVGVRDIRLAHNNEEVQKGLAYVHAREESVVRLADDALKYI